MNRSCQMSRMCQNIGILPKRVCAHSINICGCGMGTNMPFKRARTGVERANGLRVGLGYMGG